MFNVRKPIVGGNWKLHRGVPKDATEMLEAFLPKVKEIEDVNIVICPPFTALSAAHDVLKGSNVDLGGQNMYFEESGAFTGEIAPEYLKAVGCSHVILGHSERRNIFGETDEMINKKLKVALSQGLKPIACIGEHLEDREAGRTKEIIKGQMEGTFAGLDKSEIAQTVIAYEPIWAIGTGKTATPEQAEEVHVFIRKILSESHDEETAEAVRIQYGGSIKPHNALELFSKENIDGGLVGGASLEAGSLAEIVKAARESIQ
jgi:triosephosphate isomerase